MAQTCDNCLFWKKDWGIWAHNRWTREHSDKGWCLGKPMNPPLDMAGTSIPCFDYSLKPEPVEVFYATNQRSHPSHVGGTGESLQGTDQVGAAVSGVHRGPV